MFTLSFRQVGDITIIDAIGRLVASESAYDLLDAIRKLIAEGKRKVVLNLEDTDYVDATGVGILVSGFTKLADVGGRLKLLALQEQPREKLRITKLDTVLEIYEDEMAAFASFG
jgi:anti-sigma B factor antagonist